MSWTQTAGRSSDGAHGFDLPQAHHPDSVHSSEFAALHKVWLNVIERVSMWSFQTITSLRMRARSIFLVLNGVRWGSAPREIVNDLNYTVKIYIPRPAGFRA